MRILVLTNMYPGPRDPDFGAFVKHMGDALRERGNAVEVAAIDARGGGPLGGPGKYGGLARRALVAARRCDVIYAHFLFPTAAIAAAARRLTGVPWVVTAHGQDVANLERPVVRRATQRALRSCSAAIAVSRYLEARMRTYLDPLPPVEVINMGVDVTRFVPGDRDAARRELGVSPFGPLVLAVGGLTRRKDPLTLLQAVARLREDHPDVRVAFVGDGPLAAAVDAGAESLGMARHVIRPGALAHDRVATWIQACDVLSMDSRVEPLGVVALEALASGRPVVATARGGAHEVVPTRGPGRIVEPGDPALLAAALGDVLADQPDPMDCRAAAAPHRLARQAERVEAVLMRALTGPEDDTLTPRGRPVAVVGQEPPDHPDVLRLMEESAAFNAATYPDGTPPVLDPAALEATGATLLVARSGGAAVGCAALVPHGTWGEVRGMYVEPGGRGAGLGRRLLDALEAVARDAGIGTLRLEAGTRQPEALALYEAAGYIRRDAFEGYAPDPRSVFMEKPL